MSEQTIATKPVQNALNLIATIKSPEDQIALQALLEQSGEINTRILTAVGTVHFARFVFLANNTQLALFTDYDHDLDSYVLDFIKVAHDLFNALLVHIADAPPLPVQEHPNEFVKWVHDHDAPSVAGYFFSAYPNLTVPDVLSLAHSGAPATEDWDSVQ